MISRHALVCTWEVLSKNLDVFVDHQQMPYLPRQASSPQHQIFIWICSDGVFVKLNSSKTNTEATMRKYEYQIRSEI